MSYVKWFKCCAFVAALFLGYIPAIRADTVRRLEDVWFKDGTPVVGSIRIKEGYYGPIITWWDFRTFSADGMQGMHYYSDDNGSKLYRGGEPLFLIFEKDCGEIFCDNLFIDTELGEYDEWQLLDPDVQIDVVQAGEWHWRTGHYRDAGSGGRFTAINAIPVPPSLLLLGTGLIGLGWRKYRRRKK